MSLSRRELMAWGGGGFATLALATSGVAADGDAAGDVVEIHMGGTQYGEHVWFRPNGVAVAPGTTIRFINDDKANSHTATAYHPDIDDRQRRIPEAATPWDSDYLGTGATFEVTLDVPGVYDFYCKPHEFAGMVGRIVVGTPDDEGFEGAAEDGDDLPDVALENFPSVDDILARGSIDPAGLPDDDAADDDS